VSHGLSSGARKGTKLKGDRIEVLVDVGSGVKTFEVVASRAGRRLEVSVSRGTVEVAELTRTAQPVRTARFMASRVVALVEYPAADIQRSQPGDRQADDTATLSTSKEKGGPADRSRV